MVSDLKKILIIRMSSFGDVSQCLSVPAKLQELQNNFKSKIDLNSDKNIEQKIEVHWVVREDFAVLLNDHPDIKKVWAFNRNQGLTGLFKLIFLLKKENFSHIYDAHNSLRSFFISCMLRPPLSLTRVFSPPIFLKKSQKRWQRFLLFNFRINKYKRPFSGQRDLIEPLTKWGLDLKTPEAPQIFCHKTQVSEIQGKLDKEQISSFICLAPSAAHKLKRWPLDYWKKLVKLHPNIQFVLLGGKEDLFLEEIRIASPKNVSNWAGRTRFDETTALISLSKGLISNDTGALHLAEQLGQKAIALMGPAPFGYPSRPSTLIFDLQLNCQPCSKHGQKDCQNSEFHKCMIDIRPESVSKALLEHIL